MSEPHLQPTSSETPAKRGLNKSRALLAGIAIAVLAVGAAAGAGGTRLAQRWQPQSVMLLQPTSIDRLEDDSPVAVNGNVAEIFGNKFILQDRTGRVLVELGPRGEMGDAVTKGETVTVQGNFDRGFIHAQIVSHADGRSEAFGPPRRPDRGPPPPPRAWSDRGLDQGPPPPPRPWAERAPDQGPPPPPTGEPRPR
ncbi:NirD/YgiW/YdeI family stress tolerance protein [Rhodoplanes sp. Z2-YC6860]|uniref:NirD/YgiW/YdeI family stress tolerance protein n=1 Tax=Rhodoplanes sp. Z2-YC6860 TaxID=674703 RepID=UPI00078C552E|nr:NirD/YgiW/YdeI family stress tolerance protein [Rhodoplanes sp. Z2-YC6860]AMN44989.1 hypothetical protein RHPLAN_65830 [Rhodoplanes sp. Z2-YC6860]